MLERGRDGGRRGQAVVIGAVLGFALLITVLGVAQLEYVPAEVEQQEALQDQQARADMLDLGAAARATAIRGDLQPVTVRTGVQYDLPFILVAPPAPRGALATEPLGTLKITNVTRAEGARSYPADGSLGPYRTTALTFEPRYNQYNDSRTAVYESGLVVNQFGNGAEVRAGGTSFIEGRSIALVTVTGSLDAGSSLTQPVTFSPVSAPAQAVSVTNTSGAPVTIQLPTRLSNETWAAVLEPEYVANGGHVHSHKVTDGVLVVRLEQGVEYDLRLARLRIGRPEGPNSEPATHLVTLEGGSETVPPGGSQLITVQARDRYNNPVTGVRIHAQADAVAGTVRSTSRLASNESVGLTDSDGRASFVLTANGTAAAQTQNLSFSIVDQAVPPSPTTEPSTPTADSVTRPPRSLLIASHLVPSVFLPRTFLGGEPNGI